MRRVFISYSTRDKEFARKLATDLSRYDIEPWIDEWEIKVGDSVFNKISEGINQSDYILVVLSEASIRSRWVQKEINVAVAKDPKKARDFLIPVVLEEVDLPPFIRDIHYVDLTKLTYQEGIFKIVEAISKIPSKDKPRPTQLIDVSDLAKEVAIEVAQILKVSPEGIREEDASAHQMDPKLVFVIMAFSADMEPVFEGIEAAGRQHGLRVQRVIDLPGDYRITTKIIDMIHRAWLIVADLTHERPNVYFELGYARGLGKTIVTIAREGTTLHFDVKDWTCIFYSDSRVLERRLRERFAHELGQSYTST